MGGALILAAAGAALAVLLAVRLWVVLRPRAAVPRRSLSLLVVAGSGGHTTEILRLLETLSDAYSPRHYVIADTDEMSAHKINSFELNRADRNPSTTPEASRPGRAAPGTVRSSCKARGRTGAQPCLSLTSQMRVGSQRLVEDPWSQPGLPASQLRERGPEKPTPQSDRAGPEQDPAWRPRPLHQRSLPGTSPSATMK
ncbi:UDP-N-acetylglucosamine transferase subunit ALG14 homolog isoform X4 [Sus scrofa]|uniref:UDP-N-acetylglucosamine transferase subunit ALG14 homolog isoform X4 n=1 Tax=Sus scrofa TaxID=9823 RepID=UPI000A2AFE1F|nr:UDP-N-acetylglucosamine transferase subunit ALG14 homolog isoform X4 [Sus scrofa]